MTDKQDRAMLMATARAVAEQLKSNSQGTQLRVRIPSADWTTQTGGWRVIIGDLGKDQPWLQIWFDKFSGHPDRKFYACFLSYRKAQIISITKRASRDLWPIRTITSQDVAEDEYFSLDKRLKPSEFNAPILEDYDNGTTFFGLYDPTTEVTQHIDRKFCNRAAAFFEDVARSLPSANTKDEHREIYPQIENRQKVVSHLRRERSRLLATECKIRDSYKCRVCGFQFETLYDDLGIEFAEAHHIVPLYQSSGPVKTRLEDLKTVCANCHRMLHRMKGEAGDIAKLKKIVSKNREQK